MSEVTLYRPHTTSKMRLGAHRHESLSPPENQKNHYRLDTTKETIFFERWAINLRRPERARTKSNVTDRIPPNQQLRY